MNFYKIALALAVVMILCFVLSYLINWTTTYNIFTILSLFLCYAIVGMHVGRVLTIKEMEE